MKKQSVFNAYSHYYDLLYQDKNYEAETRYIQVLLSRFGSPQCDILEFGSGTGRHASLLVNEGHRVHGIDQSIEMVLHAPKIDGFTCQQCDICTIRLNKTYDAVLSLFHVISYQVSNLQLSAVFSTAAEHLEPGGIFTFDFWYSPAVYAQSPTVRVKRMKNQNIEILRIAEPVVYSNQNRVDVNYTIFAKNLNTSETKIITETHPMRHFSLPEIDLVATSNGFERICQEEFLSGGELSEQTWSACVVLRKA